MDVNLEKHLVFLIDKENFYKYKNIEQKLILNILVFNNSNFILLNSNCKESNDFK